MFNKISVLIPTRRRPRRLRTLIDSFRRCTPIEHQAELVFRVDDDDEASREFLMMEGFIVIVGPRMSGYASLPVFFNEAAEAATGDVLMLGNDDMVFHTINWASLLLSAANLYPDGLFDLGVKTHNEAHFPFACISKKVVEQLGFIADPNIFWVDIYLRDVMAAFGRCVSLPEVHIAHDWAGHVPDQTFSEGSRNPAESQPDYWTRVHPAAVNAAIARLQEMWS